ncbi:hypothetical protein FB451DRAFT_1478146 [Mycena latifolia]|nr:hypothetical protein FB451DRAFT_1478146 [Mycena latifolia]
MEHQLAQELVDHIIDFLRDIASFATLRPSHSLTAPPTTPDIPRNPLCHLQSSTHAIFFADFNLFLASALALQQLFSLPSLRSDQCSHNVTHLDLTCYHTTTEALHVVPHHCTTPIKLNSLRISAVETVRDWLNHPLCPFDFSGVTGLSVFTCTDVLQWPKFRPLVQTISVLSFYASANKPAIDLSAFSNLTLLRTGLYASNAWPNARQTLSTISPLNRIPKIILVGSSYDVNAEELDSTFSSLHMHHSQPFEFEMNPGEYDLLSCSLPQLTSKNMVRRTDDDPNWLNRVTGAL